MYTAGVTSDKRFRSLLWRLPAICLIFIGLFISPVEAKVDLENRPLTLIPDALIEPGPADDNYIIVVEKATQQLYMLEFRKGQYYLLHSLPCTTGENIGDKRVEGDKKTPEGFYLINKKSLESELAPIYGVLAYPMDYPNFWDRLQGKSGSGIWIHGTNRPRVPLDTNGCIALENIDLIAMEEFLRPYSTPIVIYDEITYKTLEEINDEAARVKDFVEKWLRSWRDKDFKTYKSCYAKDFTSDDQKNYRAWMSHKKRLNSVYAKINVDIADLRIFRHQGTISVLFVQDYRGNGDFVSQGLKRLYLREKKGEYKITAEVWHALPPPPDVRLLSAEVKQRVIDEAREGRLMVASLPKKIENQADNKSRVKATATPTKAVPAGSTRGQSRKAAQDAGAKPLIKKIEAEIEEPEPETRPETKVKVSDSKPQPPPPVVPTPEIKETEFEVLTKKAPPQIEIPTKEPRVQPVPNESPSRVPEKQPVATEVPKEAPQIKVAAVTPEIVEPEVRKPDKSDEERVRETIAGWLDAWRSKNLEKYVGHYHPDFRYNGMNLKEFREYKRDINKKYKKISIGVLKMNVQVDGSQALVTFIQNYRSDQYKDYGLKTLILQKDAKGWHIRKESWKDMSGGARP